jgi:predicted NBD/HSP70 family sugar kinase
MIEAARNRINSRSSAVLYLATGIGAAVLVGGAI